MTTEVPTSTPFNYTGSLQTFTVHNAGSYEITAVGGAGGSELLSNGSPLAAYGYGCVVKGDFNLTAGEQIEVIVGGKGANGPVYGGGAGGGGGTFIIETYDGSRKVDIVLAVAGGGGGEAGALSTSERASYSSSGQSVSGSSSGSGLHYGYGGIDGSGGTAGGAYGGGAGGGLRSAGGSATASLGGGGGQGGGGQGGAPGDSGYGGAGGFGGGGSGSAGGGGGGGGYSGGGGGYGGSGGGGGSFDGGSNTSILVADGATGYTAGDGSANFELLCYLRGTHILTSTGEKFAERLRIGDRLVTRFGGIQTIRWIGRQSFNSQFIAPEARPVCIRTGALGPNMPVRDLYVSPGHSMLIDGLGDGRLILAEALVNGLTVTQDWAPDEIHYYQFELDSHDCIVAEGAWSESYADGPGLRARFHNASEFEALYPDRPPPEALRLCAPRPERGAALDAALRPLLARFETLPPGPLRGWIDIVEAPWTISGWAQDINTPELPVLLEIVLQDQVIGTALACDFRGDLLKAGIGKGRCGFNLTAPVRLRPELLGQLRIRRASDHGELPMSEHCLTHIASAQGEPAPNGLRVVA